MISIMIIIIVLFVLLGINFSLGKGSALITGFNTLSEKDKKKYNMVSLSKFMGKIMFALSFSMLFWIFGEVYKSKLLFVFGLSMFIGILLFAYIYANMGGRFKRKNN